MPRFELEFEVAAEDIDGTLLKTGNHKRVIFARVAWGVRVLKVYSEKHRQLGFAQQIARAMLGEEINAGEKLNKVVSVEPADNKAYSAYWCHERTWLDVKKVLENEIKGIKVAFVPGRNEEIVGLRRVA